MGEFSLVHILIVAVILLVFFGPGKLPQLGESLGKALRGFKTGMNELNNPQKKPEEKSDTSSQDKNTPS